MIKNKKIKKLWNYLILKLITFLFVTLFPDEEIEGVTL